MPELTENALTVLRARYLLKDENSRIIETPEQMFLRVSRAVASAEKDYGDDSSLWEERFSEIMRDLRFLPNSPTLMNAGKDIGQLAACFVLPVGDSMQSIFDSLKNAALILQSGGGTGFSFSRLRPHADIVRSTGGIASGPVSFMKIYNTATDVIKQGGARRGANMGILRIDHPDIIDFIGVKRHEGELANFNISVAVTDAFMEALRRDGHYDLINPRSGEPISSIRARTVFDEIVESAWQTGDPVVIFIDRVNEGNPTPLLGSIESTNPCGEQPLLPYEACVLGSLNLARYVGENGTMDFGRLDRDIETSVRFLDNTIDINKYPMPEIEIMHKGNRKVGLGVMGWADALVLMGVPYNSKKAFRLARETMRFIRDSARKASTAIAAKKGVFPNFKGSVYDSPGMPALRNATLTTIAPTGTLSIIADCSSGIEPLFALAYKRFVLETNITEINRLFVDMAKKRGFYGNSLMAVVTRKGDLRGVSGVPADVKKLFRTSHEIPYEAHIEMQAAFQEFTDNAVSKTINLPHKAKKKDVENAIMLAHEKGCKGITVFRYGTEKKGTLVKFSDID